MQRPPLPPTPNRSRPRAQQTPTSSSGTGVQQRNIFRFSTPKASPRKTSASAAPTSASTALWDAYGLDENALTLRSLYSNLLLLGIECSSVFCRYRQGQISMDELSNSTELVRLVSHFLLLTYLNETQHVQYTRDTTHCFPPIAIDKQQEFNRVVKQQFKMLSETHQQYPWPHLIPLPSCSPRYFVCLFYLSQLCLIHRLDPTDIQERFLSNEHYQNSDLTKERVKRQIRMVKSDTQRHYMMFFSKIANEKRERIEYEKNRHDLDERIQKLIDHLDHTKQKTTTIDVEQSPSTADENQFELFSNLVRDVQTKVNADVYKKLEWYIQNGLSTVSPSMGVDIGLSPNVCQQIHDLIHQKDPASSRISRLCPKFSESSSSSSTTASVSLSDLIQAASVCLERQLHSHPLSDENFAKLKLALEQMHSTIERTEQVHKTLDHLEHLPKHINHNDTEQQSSTFDQIATRFYPPIECGQQARELFREHMSKQTPNSFVTCCNTIVTTSVDDSNSDCMNDDTTIIRCQVSSTPTPVMPMNDEGMLKGLECLLLSEPTTIPITTIPDDNDDTFSALEQECKMNTEIVERPRRKTIVETNVAAVAIDDRMEEDYSQKENLTPKYEMEYKHDESDIDQLDDSIQFISPIISVPISQQQPTLPKLLEQIDTIDPY